MLTEVDSTKFSVVVQGRVVSANIATRNLAEAVILTLPADQRSLAEIVPVTSDGKQVLFG